MKIAVCNTKPNAMKLLEAFASGVIECGDEVVYVREPISCEDLEKILSKSDMFDKFWSSKHSCRIRIIFLFLTETFTSMSCLQVHMQAMESDWPARTTTTTTTIIPT